MNYRICPSCGASLDPGERCDCRNNQESQAFKKKRKKKAVPVLQHQDGKVNEIPQTTITDILHSNQEDCQA